MADDVVIRAEGLGKKYIIGHEAERERYVALRDVIARAARGAWRRTADMARGRAIVGGDSTEEFWALKDVSFEVRRGEVLGIIGRNGAGKSTLLKILSRITEPSEGRVTIKGRMASLLEVGTGFHPELTGRENIYLNGAILGMTRAEIKRKFDEIAAFAEVERFLDTPVKRYSSGMYVRLAFAVAAHLEPEILIIDEVLAVGDAEFQKKCLGKMGEVADHGRTVLFVSHNLGALLGICQKAVLLDCGRMQHAGEVGETVEQYRLSMHTSSAGINARAFVGPLKSICFEALRVNGRNGAPFSAASSSDELAIVVEGSALADLPNFTCALALYSGGMRLLTLHDDPKPLLKGPFEVRFTLPEQFLRPGSYSVALGGRVTTDGDWTWAMEVSTLEIDPHWTKDYRQENIGLVNLSARPQRVAGADALASSKGVDVNSFSK